MLCISRLCSRGLGRKTPGLIITNTRNIYNPLKSSRNGIIKLKSIFNNYGKISPTISITRSSTAAITLRLSSSVAKKSNKLVGSWLLICGGMVFVAVALGGVTRLTESGLSMVTWRFLGEKMPISEAQWIEEFDKYKMYPEFQIINKNMTLNEFKRIWWMEYVHRMWGRLIGAVFIVPASYFWFKGLLTKTMKIRVFALGSLIGLQGLMGWYMVKSGLENRFDGPNDVPRVSQYRLAAHLGLALLIYTGFLYNALSLLLPAQWMPIDWFGEPKLTNKLSKHLVKLKRYVYTTKGLIFLTALSGAFVAGLDAGLIYNSFPKMADNWIPDDLLVLYPMFRNFTENATTVQFDHRILGTITLTMITVVGLMSRKIKKMPGRASKAVLAVVVLGYLQVILGITTLLHHVPIPLAASHQSGTLLLLSSIVWLCHELKYVYKLPK